MAAASAVLTNAGFIHGSPEQKKDLNEGLVVTSVAVRYLAGEPGCFVSSFVLVLLRLQMGGI